LLLVLTLFPLVFHACRFIDTDGSGFLSYSELRDGFAALGVDITEEVARQLMDLFDSDHSGKESA
jgi:Ca2+-binding EF-hand superfamily protein